MCIYTCIFVCIQVYVHVYMYVCICIYIYIYMYVYIYVHRCIHIHIHIHIYDILYIHIYIVKSSSLIVWRTENSHTTHTHTHIRPPTQTFARTQSPRQMLDQGSVLAAETKTAGLGKKKAGMYYGGRVIPHDVVNWISMLWIECFVVMDWVFFELNSFEELPIHSELNFHVLNQICMLVIECPYCGLNALWIECLEKWILLRSCLRTVNWVSMLCIEFRYTYIVVDRILLWIDFFLSWILLRSFPHTVNWIFILWIEIFRWKLDYFRILASINIYIYIYSATSWTEFLFLNLSSWYNNFFLMILCMHVLYVYVSIYICVFVCRHK